MATAQGFIQPIAQGNQPLSPNNGNPNTVYNRAAPAAPVSGWASNPITPAANYTGVNPSDVMAQSNAAIAQNGWAAPAAPTSPAPQGIMKLPDGWAESLKNFTPKETTPTTPTPTTPTTPPNALNDNSIQWITKDSKGVPGMNANLYASDPAYKKAYDDTLAIHQKRYGKNYTTKSNSEVLIADLKKAYAANIAATSGTTPATGTGASGTAGGGSGSNVGGGTQGVDIIGSVTSNLAQNNGAPANKGWNSGEGDMAQKLSNAVDGALNTLKGNVTTDGVMKFLDVITEPWLPGNMYMSQLGSVNMPNALTAVLNVAVPGLGTLGKWLAGKIPDSAGGVLGKIRDFFLKGKFQEAANEIYKNYDMEKAQNIAIGGGMGSGGFVSAGRPAMGWVGGGGGGGSSSSSGTVTVGEPLPVTKKVE